MKMSLVGFKQQFRLTYAFFLFLLRVSTKTPVPMWIFVFDIHTAEPSQLITVMTQNRFSEITLGLSPPYLPVVPMTSFTAAYFDFIQEYPLFQRAIPDFPEMCRRQRCTPLNLKFALYST